MSGKGQGVKTRSKTKRVGTMARGKRHDAKGRQ